MRTIDHPICERCGIRIYFRRRNAKYCLECCKIVSKEQKKSAEHNHYFRKIKGKYKYRSKA